MKREEYRALLGRLPFKTPTREDLQSVCPHLTEDEVVKAFERDYVALPPLRVGYSCQLVHNTKEWVEQMRSWRGSTQVVIGTKNHPAILGYSHAVRTPDSYASGQGQGDAFYGEFGMEQAIRFAEANWSEELVLDSWVACMQTYVQDPTELVNDTYHKDTPRTRFVLTCALSRRIDDIMNDHSKPKSELFDEAIVEMTVDRMIANELRGGRGMHTQFQCAHCGHGLGVDHCGGCKYGFRDDQVRAGMNTPLSRKMVEYLRSQGHIFKITPEVAWTKEWREWKDRRR